jgi:hypothetical protein
VESGARNIDHILRGSLLPLLSSTILRGIAEEANHTRIRVSLDASSGNFECHAEGV